MKNIVIAGIVLLVSMVSCSTDLEQNGIVQPNFENASPETLVNASYAYLKAATNFTFYYGDLRSDDGQASSGESPHADFDIFDKTLAGEASDQMHQHFWNGNVLNILHSNGAVLNSENDSEINGEARFLRAYSYFMMVQTFGGIPIVESTSVAPEDFTSIARRSVDDVYAYIINDLNLASSSLPDVNGNGRPSKYAAKALLAKVYMANSNFTSAETLLKDVIDNSGASLEDSYSDVFDNDNELNDEIIFAVQYDASDANTDKIEDDLDLDLTNTFTISLSGSESKILYPVTADLENAYDTADVRDEVTFNGTGISKYLPEDGTTTDKNADWIVLRLADVILLYAEAVNENNSLPEASILALMDDIRERAGLAPLTSIPSKDGRRDAIKLERRLELAFEGHRWFDLVRWNDAESVLGLNESESEFLLFPIPTREVNATGGAIEQNPAYL